MHEYKTLQHVCIGEHSISPIQYANGHFFMVWNLCPDLLINGPAEPNQGGTVSLEL